MKKSVIIILTAFVFLLSMTACDFGSNDVGHSGDDEFKQAYEEALGNFVEKNYDTSIPFQSLEMDSDSYVGKLLRQTGKITKIEKTSDGKADVYHIAVENSSDKVIWAQTSTSGKSVVDAVAEDDTVHVYGKMYGVNLFTPIIYVVRIVKTDEVKGTRSNPYPVGEIATYNGMDAYMSSYAFIAEIAVTEIIRGDEATAMFDNNPEAGKEFFLMKIKVKAIESKDDEKVEISDNMFTFVNKDGVEYSDWVSVSGVEELDNIYVGAETEGYICYIIDAGDEPLVYFSGANDVWFSSVSSVASK